MASLPPQRSASSQRPSLASNESEASAPEPSTTQNDRIPASPSSAAAKETDTVGQTVERAVNEQDLQIEQSSRRQTSEEEPRKCWICFADETEDTPMSSAWRSPCPCALRAHESCLLDWVADLEAPSTRKRTGAQPKIQCPQCKSEIKIARPRSFIVEGVQAIDRVGGKLVVPGIAVALTGMVFTACWTHGLTSIYLVFGIEDSRILLLGGGRPQRVSPKWGLGLPLIPLVLIASRTTLADGILPILPVLFFVTQVPDSSSDFWPPSPAMTFGALPYIRAAYNALYKHFLAAKEQQWINEVQPRAGENDPDGNEQAQPALNVDNEPNQDLVQARNNFEFEFNLEIMVQDEEDDNDIPPQQAGELALGAAQPAAGNAQVQNIQRDIVLSTSRIADSIIGALCFPAIASAMGELLKVLLPHAWTAASTSRRPGLLHTRWGRAVIGGCLFVVTKDMLVLYSRYRLAQDHKKRRIVDYHGSKAKAGGR